MKKNVRNENKTCLRDCEIFKQRQVRWSGTDVIAYSLIEHSYNLASNLYCPKKFENFWCLKRFIEGT